VDLDPEDLLDDEDPPAPKRRSLLGHDIDVLAVFLKRTIAVGTAAGMIHHVLHRLGVL
jgi:hypothetical protein